MPSLKPGNHKLSLVLDTKTLLGTLTAERTITVEDPAIARLQKDYASARKAGNSRLAFDLCKKLMAQRLSTRIKPGQALCIEKPNNLSTGKQENLRVQVKWYAEKDRLRAVINAVDPAYAAIADPKKRKERAYVSVYVCPSGADQDICGVGLSEGDKDGTASARMVCRGKWTDVTQASAVKATWRTTADGYTAEVKIPWSALPGYDRKWTVLPVEAAMMVMGKQFSYYTMTRPGNPDVSARSYSLLTRK